MTILNNFAKDDYLKNPIKNLQFPVFFFHCSNNEITSSRFEQRSVAMDFAYMHLGLCGL